MIKISMWHSTGRIIIFLLLVVLLIFITFKLNKNFLLLWNANSINVETVSQLSNQKIKIFQDSLLIYNQGKTNKIENYYGENDFVIRYDDKYEFKFRHFKTNRRHQHTYKFYFFEKGGYVFVRIKIKGIDDMEIEDVLVERK